MHTIGLLVFILTTTACVNAEKMLCKVCMSLVKVLLPIVEKGGNIAKALLEKCTTSAPKFMVPQCENILGKVANFTHKAALVTPEEACIHFKACKEEKAEGSVSGKQNSKASATSKT